MLGIMLYIVKSKKQGTQFVLNNWLDFFQFN